MLVRRAVKRAAARADALADEEEEEEMMRNGSFLLSLDHETFDRNSFGGGGGGENGSSWLSPSSPPAQHGSGNPSPLPKSNGTNGGASSLIDV